jgi:hypothetical protein
MKPNITQKTAQSEVFAMPAKNNNLRFDRSQILNRYWELANLGVEETKGNITGQLKALDSLLEQLGVGEKPAKPHNVQEIYRSAWMVDSASTSKQ